MIGSSASWQFVSCVECKLGTTHEQGMAVFANSLTISQEIVELRGAVGVTNAIPLPLVGIFEENSSSRE